MKHPEQVNTQWHRVGRVRKAMAKSYGILLGRLNCGCWLSNCKYNKKLWIVCFKYVMYISHLLIKLFFKAIILGNDSELKAGDWKFNKSLMWTTGKMPIKHIKTLGCNMKEEWIWNFLLQRYLLSLHAGYFLIIFFNLYRHKKKTVCKKKLTIRLSEREHR